MYLTASKSIMPWVNPYYQEFVILATIKYTAYRSKDFMNHQAMLDKKCMIIIKYLLLQ